MKNALLPVALILVILTFQACQNSERTSKDQDSLTNVLIDSAQLMARDTLGLPKMDTADFMNNAAISGKMEVEFGELAQRQSSNAKVKEFGALMVKFHTKQMPHLNVLLKPII